MNDLPLTGRKFTWHRADGRCVSRLDRFLISDEWMSRWQISHNRGWKGMCQTIAQLC